MAVGGAEGVWQNSLVATAATASADKTVKLWDLSTGKELGTLQGHSGAVRAVAFDIAGTRVATAGVDKTVRIWSVATGKDITAFTGHTSEATSLVFTADGRS